MGIAAFTSARDRLLEAERAELTSEQVCGEILRAIGRVAPFQAAAVMTTDPETHLPSGGVVRGFEPSACVPFWDNELLDPDFNKFNDLARSLEPVATLFDATDGELDRSPRYQRLYAAAGAVDELRVAFTSGPLCLGIGVFVRSDGEAFTPTEARDVANLRTPAANALRRAFGRLTAAMPGGGPAVLLLDGDGDIVTRSAGADEVLADLRLEVDDDVPGTIRVAAARARSRREPAQVTTRMRGSSGRWVRVHVSPMSTAGSGDGDGPGATDLVSVTIATAGPGELVPILLDSYGLTERETDIVLALCRGVGTKDIAAELSISVHTVRDHLKVVFDKAGVNSRGELVARLFADHVLGPFEANVEHA